MDQSQPPASGQQSFANWMRDGINGADSTPRQDQQPGPAPPPRSDSSVNSTLGEKPFQAPQAWAAWNQPTNYQQPVAQHPTPARPGPAQQYAGYFSGLQSQYANHQDSQNSALLAALQGIASQNNYTDPYSGQAFTAKVYGG